MNERWLRASGERDRFHACRHRKMGKTAPQRSCAYRGMASHPNGHLREPNSNHEYLRRSECFQTRNMSPDPVPDSRRAREVLGPPGTVIGRPEETSARLAVLASGAQLGHLSLCNVVQPKD
jgi:hypothetical protein